MKPNQIETKRSDNTHFSAVNNAVTVDRVRYYHTGCYTKEHTHALVFLYSFAQL